MAKHEIEILITPEGDVKLDMKGLKGPGCLPEAKKIADALGEVKTQSLLPEYYEQTKTDLKKRTGS